ncbi:MAG: DUF6311 domain-containing protein [Clostridiales bacterium]|nr:DUF6311 domain-containing protein [Clostridiales bacterium]MDU1041391.1 DUF6311 domain-containing protein [Clostridiales bacterium]
MKAKLSGKIVFLIGLAVGAISFLIVFGPGVMNVTNDTWLISDGGDMSQHYVGWIYYRNSPWTFPIGLLEGITSPDKFSVTYMDSIPILAFIFKIFAKVLPGTFQYFGIYGFVTFMLQGGLGGLLIYSLTKNVRSSIAGSVLFTFTPVFLQRMYTHTALAFHPVILLSLYFLFNRDFLKKKRFRDVIFWTVLMAVASTIHIYFIPMILFIMLGYYFFEVFSKGWYKAIIKIAITIGVTLIVMYIFGDFYGNSKLNVGGLGDYNSNVNALLNDQGTSMVERLKGETSTGRWEEYSYLGAGIIGLAVISVIGLFTGHFWKKLKISYLPIALMVLAFLVLSMLPSMRIGPYTIFTVHFTEDVQSKLAMFRSNGRFMWPVIYLIMTGAIVYVTKNFKKLGACVVIVMTALQLFDLTHYIREKNENINTAFTDHKSALTSDAWNKIKAKEVYFMYEPVTTKHMMGYTFNLGKYASDHGMVMNDFYVSRKNDGNIIKKRESEIKNILDGKADSKKLYVFSDIPVSVLYSGKSDLNIYKLDGVYVGLTDKLEGEQEIDRKSSIDLIGMHTIYTDKGDVEDNGITVGTQGQTMGPYITLEKGNYHVTWKGDNLDDCRFKATALRGEKELNIENLRISDKEASFDIKLKESNENVEFIVVNPGKGEALISGIVLSRDTSGNN